MGIHKSERKQSSFEVMDHCVKLKKEIRELIMLRNFGYKVRAVTIPSNWEKWSESSRERYLQRENEKLEKLSLLDREYLGRKRDSIENILMTIVYEIASANSLYSTVFIEELNEKRLHQDRAIMACEHLRLDLQDVIDTVPIQKNWMLRVAPDIEKEIALIKAWRKSDNPKRRELEQKQGDQAKTMEAQHANIANAAD